MYFDRHKGIIEIRKLRRQLTNEINLISSSSKLVLDPKMPPPNDDQVRFLLSYFYSKFRVLAEIEI